ncbi:MAG: response regulator [Candidatus Hodarchaeales archaeon]
MKKRLLFVDDDELILYCYLNSLESDKVVIYTATNVESALDIVKDTKIDIAVLDYLLPEIRGDELAKRIYQIDPGVKIFFISGYNLALEPIKQLNLPIYGVFQKPVDFRLIEKIAYTEDYMSFYYQIASLPVENIYSNIISKGALIQNQIAGSLKST